MCPNVWLLVYVILQQSFVEITHKHSGMSENGNEAFRWRHQKAETWVTTCPRPLIRVLPADNSCKRSRATKDGKLISAGNSEINTSGILIHVNSQKEQRRRKMKKIRTQQNTQIHHLQSRDAKKRNKHFKRLLFLRVQIFSVRNDSSDWCQKEKTSDRCDFTLRRDPSCPIRRLSAFDWQRLCGKSKGCGRGLWWSFASSHLLAQETPHPLRKTGWKKVEMDRAEERNAFSWSRSGCRSHAWSPSGSWAPVCWCLRLPPDHPHTWDTHTSH